MLISFEGVEGAGKTTQMRLLAERLEAERGLHNVLLTREPGDGPLGQELRRLVLHPPSDVPVDARAELFIMLADRAQHVGLVIGPHLAADGVVLCDRYADSSVAYQGYGRGLDIAHIQSLNVFATQGLVPHLTVLLDIDPALGLARQHERSRMERETLPFHERVRAGFLSLAQSEPERFAVINAARLVDAVHADIWAVVASRLPSRS